MNFFILLTERNRMENIANLAVMFPQIKNSAITSAAEIPSTASSNTYPSFEFRSLVTSYTN